MKALVLLLVVLIAGCTTTQTIEETTTTVEPTETAVTTVLPTPLGESTTTTSITRYYIEGDDNGLYPNTITVNAGEVEINFHAREVNTYYGGLDFRAQPWGDTGTVLPGQNKTIRFTATSTFEFRSYWPASNAQKAWGTVRVT